MEKRLSRSTILIAGFVLEGFLVVVFVAWAYYREFDAFSTPSLSDLSWGLLLTLPLLLFNFLLYEILAKKSVAFTFIRDFVAQVVKPLADELDWVSGLIVSVCAGVGEELFFRGVLQNEFGIIVASVLFALLHFGTAAIEYFRILLLYVFIGFYLGFVYQAFGVLWVPIIVHIAYDFLALLYLKHKVVCEDAVVQSPVGEEDRVN